MDKDKVKEIWGAPDSPDTQGRKTGNIWGTPDSPDNEGRKTSSMRVPPLGPRAIYTMNTPTQDIRYQGSRATRPSTTPDRSGRFYTAQDTDTTLQKPADHGTSFKTPRRNTLPNPQKQQTAQEAHLSTLRQNFEDAGTFEDDHLFLPGLGMTTRHHIQESADIEKERAARTEAAEAKKEAEKVRNAQQQRSFYYSNYFSPVKETRSAPGNVYGEEARRAKPWTRHDEAPATLAAVPVAHGYLEGLGGFGSGPVQRGQGQQAKGSSSMSERSSGGDGSLDPEAYTFKPKIE